MFIGAIVLSLFIVRPFILAIIASAIVAYIAYPIFEFVNGRLTKNRTVAALIVSLFVLLIIILPMVYVVTAISDDALSLYRQVRILLSDGLLEDCDLTVCNLVENWLAIPDMGRYIRDIAETAVSYLFSWASKVVVSIPRILIQFFIMAFTTFYLIRDGDKVVAFIKKLFTEKSRRKEYIFKRFNDVLYSIIFGSIIVAFIQGIIGAIGFLIVGIDSPVLWGLVMFFLALIPYLGTGLVWLPFSAGLIIGGLITGETIQVWKGVGLLIYGLLVISSVDNIVKPLIVGNRSKVHPVLILIGIFGGLAVMGLPGIIVGPVVLAMLVTFIEIYVSQDRKDF